MSAASGIKVPESCEWGKEKRLRTQGQYEQERTIRNCVLGTHPTPTCQTLEMLPPSSQYSSQLGESDCLGHHSPLNNISASLRSCSPRELQVPPPLPTPASLPPPPRRLTPPAQPSPALSSTTVHAAVAILVLCHLLRGQTRVMEVDGSKGRDAGL